MGGSTNASLVYLQTALYMSAGLPVVAWSQ